VTHIKSFLLILAGCLLGIGIAAVNEANAHTPQKVNDRFRIEAKIAVGYSTMFVVYDRQLSTTCYIVENSNASSVTASCK
jgi:hypothetical protein